MFGVTIPLNFGGATKNRPVRLAQKVCSHLCFWFGRPSRRDSAKALAALHARIQLHLLTQAVFTLFLHPVLVLSPLWPWPDTSRILQFLLSCVPVPMPHLLGGGVTPSLCQWPIGRRGTESTHLFDYLDPSTIEPSEPGQVQVADEHVRSHPGTCFPTHLCR